MEKRQPKPKSCGVCEAKFKPWSTTQRTCFSAKCALEWARIKSRKQSEREARAASTEFKRRDMRWQHKQTQPVYNRMRVKEEFLWFHQQGLEPECISCGKTNRDWCCGHFKTVGSQPELRYSPLNTFLQCNTYCNLNLSGNIAGTKHTRGFRQGLIERFGPEQAKSIIDYCETPRDKKVWDWQELEAFRAECAARERELKRALHDIY